DPQGRRWPGARSMDEVVGRLADEQAKLADPERPLVGWGFDPLYFGGRRCERGDLDRVSTTRRVAVLHASAHIINANTPALEAAGYLRPGISHPGLPLAADGLPSGEVLGPEAMGPLAAKVGLDREFLAADSEAVRAFSRLCVRKGVTTATDLASPMTPQSVDAVLSVTEEAGFPTRIVGLLRFST